MYFNVDHFEKACYYYDGNTGGSDFNGDNFEDCHIIDGHKEGDYFNNGQGVYETLGAYIEASTTSLVIKASTPTWAGAKDGLSAPPKVQTKAKPEETKKQDEKGSRNY